MHQQEVHQPDFGTGPKKLSIYVAGLIMCSILTLIAFGTVMANVLPRGQVFTIIYAAACIQLVVQVVCFLRLNTQTEQSKNNVMSLIFTAVILTSIMAGSLWIMWNVQYYMMSMS